MIKKRLTKKKDYVKNQPTKPSERWQSGLMQRSWNRSGAKIGDRVQFTARQSPNRRQDKVLFGFPEKRSLRITYTDGEVAEWFNAAVLKTVEGATPPRVRISASPPIRKKPGSSGFFCGRSRSNVAGLFSRGRAFNSSEACSPPVDGLPPGHHWFCRQK